MENFTPPTTSEENVFSSLLNMFRPYWPIFATLVPLSLMAAWLYLKMATPVYQASATLIIKDENKGVDDAKVMESMNPFESKKIVENEIEIIKSRELMGRVVSQLQLYAPIYEERFFGTVPAYYSSPVQIALKNPNKIYEYISDEPLKLYFTYDASSNSVMVKDKGYVIDQWFNDPIFGEIKFTLNPNAKKQTQATGDFYYTFVTPKALTNNFLKNLTVSTTNKLSTVVRLTYNDPIPQRAEEILNHLIAAYNQKAVTDRNSLASNTLQFIEERMVAVEKELDELERNIEQFRSSEGAIDLSEQAKLYLQDVGGYDRQIAEMSRQYAVLGRVERYVVNKDKEGGMVPSTVGVNDAVLSQLLERLYDAELEYERLSKTTAENNPILVSVSNEIAKIRPSILENIKSQKSSISASLGNLQSSSAKSSSVLKGLPEKERELLEIGRKKAIKNELYAFLLQTREETALSYAPNAGDSRVVDLAEASPSPVSPIALLAYLVALVLSFGIGLAYVVYKEKLNSKVLFRSEIEEYTAIPIAIELPDISTPRDLRKETTPFHVVSGWYQTLKKRLLKTKTRTGTPQTKAKMPKMGHPGTGILYNQFCQLAASLGLYDRTFNKKKILVTSSISGEGKSFVSSNLAHCLAETGKRVVLLDMDFINPQTSKTFDLAKANGLLNYLDGSVKISEIIKATPNNDNLTVIPVGEKVGNHTRLLLNGKLDSLFEVLSKEFDYIIIDSAPTEFVADINLLSNYTDHTLFVIRHAYTPMQIIKHLRQSIALQNLPNKAIVFNGIKKRGLIDDQYGYGYGYSQQGYEYSYQPFEKHN